MSVLRYESLRNGGGQGIRHYPKKASQVFKANSLVGLDANGQLDVLPANQSTIKFVGIIKKAVTSTDKDFAANTIVAIDTFQNNEDTFVCGYSGTAPKVGELVGRGTDTDQVEKGVTTTSFRVVKVLPGNKVVIKLA